MTLAAFVSIWSVVAILMSRRALVVYVLCCVRFVVASFPSRYWSIRFCGIGILNGGWLLVIGFGRLFFVLWVWMSPIWGSSWTSALWSPYSGVYVVMVVF